MKFQQQGRHEQQRRRQHVFHLGKSIMLEECGQEIQTLYRSLTSYGSSRLAQEKDRMQPRLRQQQDRQEEQAAAQKQQRELEEEAIRQCEQEICWNNSDCNKKGTAATATIRGDSQKHARIAELRRQIQEVEDATKTATKATATTTLATQRQHCPKVNKKCRSLTT
jgi:hypothetical protein